MAAAILWDLTVFEESTALSMVYHEGSRQAGALHRVAGNAFKLLPTGMPVEKNIMELGRGDGREISAFLDGGRRRIQE